MKQVAVLGATGSIGRNTLDVIARHPARFRVTAVTAGCRWQELLEVCHTHRPSLAVLADEAAADRLRYAVTEAGLPVRVACGDAALLEAATHSEADTVVAGIVGAAGLAPTLAAAEAGRRVLLANKEALVVAGPLLTDAVARHGAELLPVDSEHNAIFQCLPPDRVRDLPGAGVERILLTGSGGPFRTLTEADLAKVTPAQACAHPNWAMGQKISVDSATLMNKGLELIEACWLFATTPDRVEVIIHPQSIVHSMVRYLDGSVLAQMGRPDMRTPIAHALGWPERIDAGVEPLDPIAVGPLEFETPDEVRFPCLSLAREAIRAGGTAPAVLNAANEVAVEAFLNARLSFPGIGEVVRATLEAVPAAPAESLAVLWEADRRGREQAADRIARRP